MRPCAPSCHTAHNIDATTVPFKLASDQRCGKCHQERLQQHLGTYHGRAHLLGGSEVAACYNCHGSHEILPQKDPASTISAANKLDTCRTCHADAPPKFASYLAHGDANDRQGYAMLFWTSRPFEGLLWGAMALFALHTLAWGARSLFAFLRSPREYLADRRRRQRMARVAFPDGGPLLPCPALGELRGAGLDRNASEVLLNRLGSGILRAAGRCGRCPSHSQARRRDDAVATS